MKLSIIIPILNEEKNILPLTNKIKNELKNNQFEIIFVDDNSADNSKNELINLKNKYNFFNPILRKKTKRDLSKSCFDGIKKSNFENILIMDGDLQHNPKYIKKMYNIFSKKKLDIVIGARKLSIKNKGLSEFRRFASNILIILFKIFKIDTTDPMSGFFIMKKKLFKKNEDKYFGKGFKILADILINSKPKLKSADYYITFNRRFESSSKMNLKILLILIQFYLISLFKKLFI